MVSVPATLSERVYSAFKRDIIQGIFQPGEALSEKELAHRYKASRTPVREAAVRLQNDRLLRIVPNRGYFVAQITLQVLNDIYEFRAQSNAQRLSLLPQRERTSEALKELTNLAKARAAPITERVARALSRPIPPFTSVLRCWRVIKCW